MYPEKTNLVGIAMPSRDFKKPTYYRLIYGLLGILEFVSYTFSLGYIRPRWRWNFKTWYLRKVLKTNEEKILVNAALLALKKKK